MIDTREEVMAPVPHKSRRRTAPVTAGRIKGKDMSTAKKSLRVERIFSDAKVQPFDQVEWDRRTAEITDDAGKVI